MKTASRILFIASMLLVLSAPAFARDIGVFVDGSYSPGSRETEMDRLIDRRLDEAQRIFDQRNNDADDESHRVDSEDDLENVLNNLECRCGDTLTIVMMGHGTNNSFSFTKDGDRLTAREFQDLLESATIECCCKIHIVIFSCHSGSFIDDLMEDPHVQSVYTSCRGNEVSRSYQEWEDGEFTDNGDWLDGFNQDWEAAPAGASVADALEEGSKSAKEKMPPGSTTSQHPQGWRRGELPVLAHVERVRKSGGRIVRMQVHFYNPEFLRCTQKWIEPEPGVEVPNDLQNCNWIQFTGRFGGPGDDITIASDVSHTSAPTEHVVAHVVGRSTSTVRIHAVEPKWMYCTTRNMTVDDPSQIAPDVQYCKWIQQDITVDDPDGGVSTGGSVTPESQTFRVKAHIEGSRNLERGTVRVHILEPQFLRCNRPTIQLPAGERGKLQNLNTCDNIYVDFETDLNADGFHTASNVRKITSQGSPTHYYQFDAALGEVVEPGSTVVVGEPFNPEVQVRNVGQQELMPFQVACMIQRDGIDVYADVQQVEDPLLPGEAMNLVFEELTPDSSGEGSVTFQIWAEDENPANNTLQLTTSVVLPDTWPLWGDATLDGKVNVLDLIFVRNRLRQDPLSGNNWSADVNDDGVINVLDLIFIRNRLGNKAETTPPFSRSYQWHQMTTLEMPPEMGGGVQVCEMHGWLTWGFLPGTAPYNATMVIQDISGTGDGIELMIDTDGDGTFETVNTGPMVFDVYDVDLEASSGMVNLRTGMFNFQTVITPRFPGLEDMGIDLLPEPLIISEQGFIEFDAGLMHLDGTFQVTAGPAAGASAQCSKGGSQTTTKKLSSRNYRVDVRAAFTLLWLRNLSIPDGTVKVKVKVKINGVVKEIEGELEVKDGNSTQGLKIGGLGDLVQVVSVEITYTP